MSQLVDVRVRMQGTTVWVKPQTPEVEEWLKSNAEDGLWVEGELAVDQRYVNGLMEALSVEFSESYAEQVDKLHEDALEGRVPEVALRPAAKG